MSTLLDNLLFIHRNSDVLNVKMLWEIVCTDNSHTVDIITQITHFLLVFEQIVQ